MSTQLQPFVMFSGDRHGKALEALQVWTEAFPGSEILSVQRWDGSNPTETEGTVQQATARIAGSVVRVLDSGFDHGFGPTPAISMFVVCGSADEVDRAHRVLSQGGTDLMPLGEYPFAARFAWVADRYGVTWQLSTAVAEQF